MVDFFVKWIFFLNFFYGKPVLLHLLVGNVKTFNLCSIRFRFWEVEGNMYLPEHGLSFAKKEEE